MNNIHKYKTSFIAKATTLASLLIFLSIGTAWGQTDRGTINMGNNNNNGGSKELNCDEYYTLQFEDVYSNRLVNKSYTFINQNGGISVSRFTFTAMRYNGNNDYLEIKVNGVTSNRIYGNTTNGWTRCSNYSWQNAYDYQYQEFEIEEINVEQPINGVATIEFIFHDGFRDPNNNIGGACTHANFEAKVIATNPECPILIEPANNAIITDNSVTLDWDDVDNATYSVAVTQNGEDYPVTNPTTSELDLNNLTPGTYTWTLSFTTTGGCTVSCEERTFMVCSGTLGCVDPNKMKPRNGQVVTSRTLSWDPVPCAAGYNVYISPNLDGLSSATPIQVPASNSPMCIPGLMPEGTYYWAVVPTGEGYSTTNSPAISTCDNVETFELKYSNSKNFSKLPSTQGKEFFFSLMENGYYTFDLACDDELHVYKAIIAPKQSGTVYFEYYNRQGDNRIVPVTVEAGQTKEVELNEDDVYHRSVDNATNDYKDRTVRVYSDDIEFSLYVSNEACNSFDASIVLPTSALGAEYMIQTFPNGNHDGAQGVTTARPCFMIIGTADDTKVRISGPSTKIADLLPAPPTGAIVTSNGTSTSYFDITLNEGESYFIRSNSQNINDLSGIKVEVVKRDGYDMDKCKTIAVFNGNTLTRIPDGNSNLDHIFEQAYPISNWGTEFAITASAGYDRNNQTTVDDYIRITAAEDDTKVKLYKKSGDAVTTVELDLDAGQTTPDPTTAGSSLALNYADGSCYITSTKPVACYLYQRSGYNTGALGDPSMVWVSPIELGIDNLTFSTFDFSVPTGWNANTTKLHYVNIVVPADSLAAGGKVHLGNTDITNQFTNDVIGSNNKYKYARINLPQHGTYTLNSDKGKMVIHTYGLGSVRGYAYNAGSAAIPYRSNFMVADGTTDDYITVSTTGYNLCSGTEYRFDINSNIDADNIYRISMTFGSGDDAETIDMYKSDDPNTPVTEVPVPEDEYQGDIPTTPELEVNGGPIIKQLTATGRVDIVADVYSIKYDNANCQYTTMVDNVNDHIFNFSSETKDVHATVCHNTPYTFTIYSGEHEPAEHTISAADINDLTKYTMVGNERKFVVSHHNFTGGSDESTDDNIYNEYGCKTIYHIYLTVYNQMKAGAITATESRCENSGNGIIEISVVQLESNPNADDSDPNRTATGEAEGGDPDAYYQWQYSASTSTTADGISPDSWTTLSNRSEVHTVTATGWYRRAYISEQCSTTVYTTPVHATASGSFDPGTHVDETIEVCKNVVTNVTIGGLGTSFTSYTDAQDNVHYYTNDDSHYEVTFQWEKSINGGEWQPMTGETSHNLQITGDDGGKFTVNTYYRRLISTVENCELNFDMGVYSVLVNPMFTVTPTVFNGCVGANNTVTNAKIQLAIEGGSGNYTVTCTSHSGTITASGGVYELAIPNGVTTADATYTFTITDNEYGCTVSYPVVVKKFEALSIDNLGSVNGCQGTQVGIPIPTIMGGTAPYTLQLSDANVFGLGTVTVKTNYNGTPAQGETHTITIPATTEGGLRDITYEVTDALGCRYSKSNETIRVYETPDLNYNITKVSVCDPVNGAIKVDVSNSSITMDDDNKASIAPYTYSITSPGTSPSGTVNSATHTFSSLSQGSYTITVTDYNGCKAELQNISVPNADPIVIGVTATVDGTTTPIDMSYTTCPNKTVTLEVTPSGGNGDDKTAYNYSFDGGSTWKSLNTLSTDPVYDANANKYSIELDDDCGTDVKETVTITVKNRNTQCTQTRTIVINVNDTEVPTITGDNINISIPTYFCKAYQLSMTNDILPKIKNNISDNCTAPNDMVITSTPTEINTAVSSRITITVTDLCDNSATKYITITPNPWPNFKINGTEEDNGDNNCYCHGDNITLTATAVLEDGTEISYEYKDASYQWYKLTPNDADPNAEENWNLIGGATEYSYTVTTSADGSHAGTYRLEITDPKGCKGYAYITICVHPAIEFHLE